MKNNENKLKIIWIWLISDIFYVKKMLKVQNKENQLWRYYGENMSQECSVKHYLKKSDFVFTVISIFLNGFFCKFMINNFFMEYLRNET